MSLVGIIKTVHGVAVFGDSKSSVLEKGVLKPNPSKEYVKKVFRGQNLIFSTSGVNQVFYKYSSWHLDDLIEKNILPNKDVTPENFMDYMQKLFSEASIDNDIYFHVGYIENEKYEAFTGCLHSDKSYTIEGSISNDFGAAWSGDTRVVPPLFDIRRDMEMDEVKGFINNYMNHVIAIGDLLLDYCPIGGDVLVETLP